MFYFYQSWKNLDLPQLKFFMNEKPLWESKHFGNIIPQVLFFVVFTSRSN